MTKATQKAFRKTLSAFLAVLMVISPFSEALGELGWFSAIASGDGDDTVHSNTAYSNGEYSVLYDKIIVVGSGFNNKDISKDLAAALGIDAKKVVYHGTVDAAKNASGAGSLVVYACGTDKIAENKTTTTSEQYATTLSADVDVFKANGADVLLVTPGPVVEYGAGMYYATHSDWTPEQIASGDNVTNLLLDYVAAISGVATEKKVGLLSIHGKAKLYGEEAYLAGTTANSGYLESKGNITIGKLYWASEAQSSAATNMPNVQTPSVINPNTSVVGTDAGMGAVQTPSAINPNIPETRVAADTTFDEITIQGVTATTFVIKGTITDSDGIDRVVIHIWPEGKQPTHQIDYTYKSDGTYSAKKRMTQYLRLRLKNIRLGIIRKQ